MFDQPVRVQTDAHRRWIMMFNFRMVEVFQ